MVNLFKTINPYILLKDLLATLKGSPWNPHFKTLKENPECDIWEKKVQTLLLFRARQESTICKNLPAKRKF